MSTANWYDLCIKEPITTFIAYYLQQVPIFFIHDEFLDAIYVDAFPSAVPLYIENNTTHPISLYTESIYSKGACVFNYMYSLLGDDITKKIFQTYISQYKYSSLTTKDLINLFPINYQCLLTNLLSYSGYPIIRVTTNMISVKLFNVLISDYGALEDYPFEFILIADNNRYLIKPNKQIINPGIEYISDAFFGLVLYDSPPCIHNMHSTTLLKYLINQFMLLRFIGIESLLQLIQDILKLQPNYFIIKYIHNILSRMYIIGLRCPVAIPEKIKKLLIKLIPKCDKDTRAIIMDILLVVYKYDITRCCDHVYKLNKFTENIQLYNDTSDVYRKKNIIEALVLDEQFYEIIINTLLGKETCIKIKIQNISDIVYLFLLYNPKYTRSIINVVTVTIYQYIKDELWDAIIRTIYDEETSKMIDSTLYTQYKDTITYQLNLCKEMQCYESYYDCESCYVCYDCES